MILIYISILSLVNAKAFEGPSYRSSVTDGGRPILRMLPEDPIEPEEVTPKSAKHEKLENEKLAKELSLLVAWLVEKLGYNLVQDIRRLSDYTKTEALKNGDSKKTIGTEPTWLMDLKSYMKDLVSQYGKKSLDKYTKPVVKSVEKKENIVIKDIDVDQYGEVFVDYEKSSKKKTKSVKKHSKGSSEESEEPTNNEHVTEILQRRIYVK